MKPVFEKDSWKEVYQRPLSFEEHEGRAMLVRCVRDQTAFDYPGLIVEEWDVRFLGDEFDVTRIIAAVKP